MLSTACEPAVGKGAEALRFVAALTSLACLVSCLVVLFCLFVGSSGLTLFVCEVKVGFELKVV